MRSLLLYVSLLFDLTEERRGWFFRYRYTLTEVRTGRTTFPISASFRYTFLAIRSSLRGTFVRRHFADFLVYRVSYHFLSPLATYPFIFSRLFFEYSSITISSKFWTIELAFLPYRLITNLSLIKNFNRTLYLANLNVQVNMLNKTV